jgi:hypothetical protein
MSTPSQFGAWNIAWSVRVCHLFACSVIIAVFLYQLFNWHIVNHLGMCRVGLGNGMEWNKIIKVCMSLVLVADIFISFSDVS